MRLIYLIVILIALGVYTLAVAAPWNAGPGELFKFGGAVAPSCNAVITGSFGSGGGNVILSGTATALANLTCQ